MGLKLQRNEPRTFYQSVTTSVTLSLTLGLCLGALLSAEFGSSAVVSLAMLVTLVWLARWVWENG